MLLQPSYVLQKCTSQKATANRSRENCTDHLMIQIQLEGTCHREGKKLLLKKLLKLSGKEGITDNKNISLRHRSRQGSDLDRSQGSL